MSNYLTGLIQRRDAIDANIRKLPAVAYSNDWVGVTDLKKKRLKLDDLIETVKRRAN